MPEYRGQAAGLARLFTKPQPLRLVSMLASPHGPRTEESVLALAGALTAQGSRVCMVETQPGSLSALLGCHPLRGWQAQRPLGEQIIRSGDYQMLSAPGRMAGDAEIANAVAASGQYEYLIFDGGRFSREEAAIEPRSRQNLVILMDENDVEAVYAIHKGLCIENSPVHSMVLGKGADRVSQLLEYFLNQGSLVCKYFQVVYLNNNKLSETSSNTLRINSNLEWVVSRIQPGNEKRVTNEGAG